MIYFGGKDIKEIYLGDKPIASVYLGGKLIWQSRVYASAGVVIALQSDTVLRTVPGVSYTVETVGCMPLVEAMAKAGHGGDMCGATVVASTVDAKPYLRHIAPMLASPPQSGIVSANIRAGCTVDPESPKTLAQGMPVATIRILGGDGGKTLRFAHPYGAVQCVPIASGNGEAGKATNVPTSIQSVRISPGIGKAGKATHIPVAVQRIPIVPGNGEAMRFYHFAEAVADIKPTGATGDPHNSRDVTGGAYAAKPRKVAGQPGMDCRGMITPLSALTETNGAGDLTPQTQQEALAETAVCSPGKALAQTIPPTESGAPLSSGAAVKPSGGQSAPLSTQATGAPMLFCAELAPGYSDTAYVHSFPSAVSVASMTTRIYIDPPEGDFDTLPISEMDILVMAEIDQMVIQNQT